MELRRLRYFAAVVEEGSLTAPHLPALAEPADSRSGAPGQSRVAVAQWGSGVEPTAAGKAFLNHARLALMPMIRPGPATPLLILFTKSLDVRFAVRIEEFFAAFLPRRFEFGRRDIPVRPAFLDDGA
jgi:hypothetical protein